MGNLLVRFVIFLTYKLDRRKAFVVVFITTMVGLILEMIIFPFPIPPHFFSNSTTSSSDMSFLVNSLPQSFSKVDKIFVRRVESSILYNISNIHIQTRKNVRGAKGRRRKRRKQQLDDYGFSTPPSPPRSPPTPFQRYIWSLSSDDALLYAKKELRHAPSGASDSELYGPIFKNVSYFKRSYELMELILKVYIYKEGEKPVFHTPWLSGIYASEGWFMKLIEENKQFVTNDPTKAHLFYLPYSARQLQQKLYIAGSHNLQPLLIFIRDYINMLSIKYPFWNQTRGSNHFLVACHDWGPYTLKEHKELVQNSIKVLCNADVSEGVFKLRRDVSLPETTIRMPSRPQRNVGGGIRVSQRPILAFFAGGMHGRVRPILLYHWRDKYDDMRIYEWLPDQIAKKMNYIQHMRSSKFCICPMGYEVNSPRIVEAIYYECIPVIIADNFVLPLEDVLDWAAFSITLPENDIPRLREVLLAVSMRRYLKLLYNLKMLQPHFVWNPKPIRYDLFHMILHSIWSRRLNQIDYIA